jgi:DNA-binding transcriptional MerR regulator
MEYVTVYEMAKRLGVYPGRIYRAHRMGRVPEPQRVGPTRLYTDADAKRLREYFESQTKVIEEKKE